MTRSINSRRQKSVIWTVLIGLFIMTLVGCKESERIFVVSVVSSNPLDEIPTWLGFKEGMAELGYVESNNLKYIVKSVPEDDEQAIDAAIKEVLNQDIDMLLTLGGHLVDQRAKEVAESTDIPVLFGSYPRPAETGLVDSISHPGGNMTGVQGIDAAPKALDFLKEIIPDIKAIYIPYNPNDVVSMDSFGPLNKAASQLGIELIADKIYSVEEAIIAIESLAENVDAVFLIPSPTLNFRSNELSRAAIKRGLPMGSVLQLIYDSDVLFSFSVDFVNNGKQLARMIQKILQGMKPADIPVETSEVISLINLRTAEKIGLDIPEIALAQATTIIRE